MIRDTLTSLFFFLSLCFFCFNWVMCKAKTRFLRSSSSTVPLWRASLTFRLEIGKYVVSRVCLAFVLINISVTHAGIQTYLVLTRFAASATTAIRSAQFLRFPVPFLFVLQKLLQLQYSSYVKR